MPDLGLPELLIILGVIVLVFGAKKLPELARSLGRSSSEFKKGVKEGSAETTDAATPASAPTADTKPPDVAEKPSE